jgi:hypothetical protein
MAQVFDEYVIRKTDEISEHLFLHHHSAIRFGSLDFLGLDAHHALCLVLSGRVQIDANRVVQFGFIPHTFLEISI